MLVKVAFISHVWFPGRQRKLQRATFHLSHSEVNLGAETKTFCLLFQVFVRTVGLQLQRWWVTVSSAAAVTVTVAPLHMFACVFPGGVLAVVVVSVVLGAALLALVISFIVYISWWDPVSFHTHIESNTGTKGKLEAFFLSLNVIQLFPSFVSLAIQSLLFTFLL